ncbi:MAG: insulinase family protein [Colwellia sp.]|nr:insulinase family protein [Colwellia sp.]
MKFVKRLIIQSLVIVLALSVNACSVLDTFKRQQVPVNPDLVMGSLENGFNYAVLPNGYPQDTIELRLVVNVGSMDEGTGEDGLAHYVEHMAFNGSKHFPDQSMIDELEKRGVRFGQHNSAYTNHQRTVYIISVPNLDDNLVMSLKILRDISDGLSINSKNFNDERGVILEEVRLRKQGQAERLRQQEMNFRHPNSPFIKHTVGTKNSVTLLTTKQAQGFYQKWYRPDNMTLIVTGAIATEDVQQKIKQQFSGLSGTSPTNRLYDDKTIYPSDGKVKTYRDKEPLNERVIFSFPALDYDPTKLADMRQLLIQNFSLKVLQERFNTLKAEQPELFRSASVGHYIRQDKSSWLYLSINSVERQAAMAALMGYQLLLQAKTFGITADEFSRVKADLSSMADTMLERKQRYHSTRLANEIIQFIYEEKSLLSVEQKHHQKVSFLNSLSKSEVDEYLSALNFDAPFMEVLSNEADISAEHINEQLLGINTANLTAWSMDSKAETLFASLITPGQVISEHFNHELATTEWQLTNGVKVLLRPHKLSPGQIDIYGRRLGGHGSLDETDLINARRMLGVKWASKIAGVAAHDFSRYMRDKNIGLGQNIYEQSSKVYGNGKTAELSTILKGIGLLFEHASFDKRQLAVAQENLRQQIQKQDKIPAVIFNKNYRALIYQQHWRAKNMDESNIKQLDLDIMASLYEQYFQDASQYTFIITGDFELEDVRSVVIGVLGNLPVKGFNNRLVDTQVRHVKDKQTLIMDIANEDKATITMRYYSEDYNGSDMIDYRLNDWAMDIVNKRLRIRIREQLGATYGVSVDAEDEFFSGPDYLTNTVVIQGDPKNVALIKRAVREEIEKLKQEAITDAEVAALINMKKRDYKERREKSSYWRTLLTNHYIWSYPQDQLLFPEQQLAEIDAVMLQQAIKRWFNPKHLTTAVLLPKPELKQNQQFSQLSQGK